MMEGLLKLIGWVSMLSGILLYVLGIGSGDMELTRSGLTYIFRGLMLLGIAEILGRIEEAKDRDG